MSDRVDTIVGNVDRTLTPSKILDISGWIAIAGGIVLAVMLILREML